MLLADTDVTSRPSLVDVTRTTSKRRNTVLPWPVVTVIAVSAVAAVAAVAETRATQFSSSQLLVVTNLALR